MKWLEKLWDAWDDSAISADMTWEMPPEHFDMSEDSLADLAGDLGAHNPRMVAQHVRETLDKLPHES